MQALVQLAIDLSPIHKKFTSTVQSMFLHISIPLSQTSFDATPASQTLRTLEYAIRHILRQSRFHIDAMLSTCSSDVTMELQEFAPILESRYTEWLCYLMCINDDIHDLSRLLDTMFSITANISDEIPYVCATPPQVHS